MYGKKAFQLVVFLLVFTFVVPAWALGAQELPGARPSGPSKPSNLTASSFPGALCVSLSWQDNSSNETGFTIQRKVENGNFNHLITTAANVTSFNDLDVVNDRKYVYRVYANGTMTNSGYSDEATCITIPNIPTLAASMGELDQQIELKWNDNLHETGYQIQKSSATSNGRTVQLIDLAADTKNYTDKDVLPGIRYTYVVMAIGTGGRSNPSNEVSIRFLAAPGNLAVNYFPSSTVLGITWKDNCTEESGFLLQRTTAMQNFQEFNLSANQTECTDEVMPNNKYLYRIKAKSGSTDTLDSIYSAQYVWFSPPLTPNNYKATALSSTEIKLEWKDVSEYETRFVIWRKGAGQDTPLEAAANASSYTDTGLKPATEYSYTICAVNEDSNTQSELTAPFKAKTKAVQIDPQSVITPVVEAVLKIGSPNMTINGVSKEIDPGKDTSPVIVAGRTLVPIKAIMDAVGGTLAWDGADKRVTIAYNGKTVELWIGSNATRVNGTAGTTDVAPQIINDRTMLPIAFISQNLGLDINWLADTQQVVIKTASE